MARNDVYLNINALSPADAVVTGQQDMTAATVPELVLGDTPTFNFYFTDNTNVWPSWAGNASYTLTWALSDAVAGDFAPAATTGNATPITGGWSVILPLNSYDLVGLLNTKRVGQPYPVQNLWQQLRVTDPSGNEVTRAMFWTPVRYRAISDTQNTESASPTGGRFVTVNNVNTLTTPTAAQFYAANPVPTSALGTAANGELLIGNGTGFTKSTLTAGTGITVTNGSGSITIDATGAQELLTATVKNAESVAITKGQVVYLFAATGGFPSVKLAYNTTDATSAKTFGVVSDTSIAPNGTGTVTCVGVVDGLNLGAYQDGDTVYLGDTPGSFTATKPYAPNHLVYVGIIERANAGNGELYVRVQNGYELDEIHDVQINAPKLAGQTLIYDATNDLWKNARLTGTANQITVTNADAAVTLSIPTNPTLPGNLTVSGTGVSSVAGTLNVTGALLAHQTAALNMAYEGSSISQLVAYGADASTYGRANIILRKAGTGVGAVTALALTSTDATLAGNLTVSGTGTSSVAGPLKLTYGTNLTGTDIGLFATSGGGLYINAPTTKNIRLGFNLGDRLTLDENTATFATNLTVSGTGTSALTSSSSSLVVGSSTATSTNAVGVPQITAESDLYSSLGSIAHNNTNGNHGFLLVGKSRGTKASPTILADGDVFGELSFVAYDGAAYRTSGQIRSVIAGTPGASDLPTALDFRVAPDASATPATAMRIAPTGNLLIKSDGIDSANGKLQLATHTTSAGGIGFGTADSLYTAGVGDLRFKTTSAEAAITLLSGGAYIGSVTAGKSTFIISGTGSTALTLDSSQRCILAGALRLNNAYTAGAPTATGYVTLQDSAGNTYKVLVGT